jgi:hypothetical protein
MNTQSMTKTLPPVPEEPMEEAGMTNWSVYSYEQGYTLAWLEVLTYHRKRFVLYGVGQWVGHIMDWRGCNFHHGRLPGTPVFDSKDDAVRWARLAVVAKWLYEGAHLSGHHAGEYRCPKGCTARSVATVHFSDLASDDKTEQYLAHRNRQREVMLPDHKAENKS